MLNLAWKKIQKGWYHQNIYCYIGKENINSTIIWILTFNGIQYSQKFILFSYFSFSFFAIRFMCLQERERATQWEAKWKIIPRNGHTAVPTLSFSSRNFGDMNTFTCHIFQAVGTGTQTEELARWNQAALTSTKPAGLLVFLLNKKIQICSSH